MMRSSNAGRRRAFTLIELMVVMTILSILAAVVVTRLVGVGTAGRETAMTSDMKTVQNALERFAGDNPKGRTAGWPTSDGQLPGTGSKPLHWGASFTDPRDPQMVKVFGIHYLRAIPPTPGPPAPPMINSLLSPMAL